MICPYICIVVRDIEGGVGGSIGSVLFMRG